MDVAVALNVVDHTEDVLTGGPDRAGGLIFEPAETVRAERVLPVANITPFRLDVEGRRVIFAEVPAEVMLSDAAFVYEAQTQHLQRLYAVDFETVVRLTEALPDPAKLIFVHSTGRCGSTLLSKALNEVEGVVGLSEPDVFLDVRHREPFEDPDYRDDVLPVLRGCVRLLCRPADRTWVIKPRSQVTAIADVLHGLYPEGKHVFMYRSALAFARSWARIFGMPLAEWTIDDESLALRSTFVPLLKRHAGRPEDVSAARFFSYFWLGPVLNYLDFYAKDVWDATLRYEEMTADPRGVLGALFAACGLPVADVGKALKAFEKDSQEGTSLSRENTQSGRVDFLLPEHEREIAAVLSEFPGVGSPGVVLPGTLGASEEGRVG